MPPTTVELAHGARRTIQSAVRGAWPLEMVAALGGVQRGATVAIERVVAFAGAGGGDGFAVSPVAFLAAAASLRASGCDWLGFVHSHPGGVAAPSQRDRVMLWHGCVQLIAGGDAPERLQLAAFWLDDEGVRPLPLAAPDPDA
jgi:proteasome lid subunit RPN8/RPN11